MINPTMQETKAEEIIGDLQILKQNVNPKDSSRSPDLSKNGSKSIADSQETFKHVIHINDKPTDPNTAGDGVEANAISSNRMLN